MPCRMDDYEPKVFKSDLDKEKQKSKKYKKDGDLATKLLCQACRILEGEFGEVPDDEPELIKWWEDHKKADERRRKRELAAAEKKRKETEAKQKKAAAKKRALTKLTEEEKEALGL